MPAYTLRGKSLSACLLWLCLSVLPAVTSGLDFQIMTTWDNRTIDHPPTPVTISLQPDNATSFRIVVSAPFFNGTKPPGLPGEPFFGLWNYEVVEVFLLNEQNQYVEIELCPHGQHLVLLLNGYRQTVRHSLFIDFVVNRTSSNWQGTAIIPTDFLPPNVTKMNAYAIHGSGNNTVYESLYPVPYNSTDGPDFHKLTAFRPFDRRSILLADVNNNFSPVWSDSLHGIRSFAIATSWNGAPLESSEAVNIQIWNQANQSLILSIDAPFYNNSAVPSEPPGLSTSLVNCEVVHFFLMNPDREYLEVQIGPFGHYLVAFWPWWNGTGMDVNYPIDSINISIQGGRWNAKAIIPLTYLPPNVNECNAASSHGNGAGRRYSSLYPVNPADGITQPDYSLTQYFKAIDMTVVYPANANTRYSSAWADVVHQFNHPNGASVGFRSWLTIWFLPALITLAAIHYFTY